MFVSSDLERPAERKCNESLKSARYQSQSMVSKFLLVDVYLNGLGAYWEGKRQVLVVRGRDHFTSNQHANFLSGPAVNGPRTGT